MTTTSSGADNVGHDSDMLCRLGICAAWHLSFLGGVLVSLLSWTSGAETATAVIRGLVTLVTLGLIGWGVNAVVIQGGKQEEGASAAGEKDTVGTSQGQSPEAYPGESSVTAGGGPTTGETQPSARGEKRDATAGDSWEESDFLAEAAS